MEQNQPSNNPTPNWRELRAQERRERRAARGNGAWIFGAILIALGILFFLQNMNVVPLNNWWALFILIPGIGSLAAAWRLFTVNDNQISGPVMGSLVTGLLLIGVTLIFLLNLQLNWELVLPALLILFGVGMLLGAFTWRR